MLASSRDADLVELPVQVDPGDMAQGLRPGDSVQVLAAYTEGARRGRAVVLLPTAEAVQVLQDPAGLTATGQERGVQLRMPSDRAPIVAAAIATARIFVVKAPALAAEQPSAASTPARVQEPRPNPSEPDISEPEASTPDLSDPETSQPGASQADGSLPDGQPVPTSPSAPGGIGPGSLDHQVRRVDDRGDEEVKTRLMTAGVGAAWEAALVQACQAGQVAAQVLHRCYDLGDLLAVAAAGQAEVAIVAAGTRWLDRDPLVRLAAAGLAVVGVASAGDENGERRLRQLGLLHIASDDDPPDILVDRARAALAAESDLGDEPPEPDAAPVPPDGDTRRTLAAVWGPKGGPGSTTVAVNLAFEAAAIGGEVLLVDRHLRQRRRPDHGHKSL